MEASGAIRMKTEGDRADLRPYVPANLLTAASGANPSMACRVRTGAVLVADLCGFTGLTRELERSGRAGVEALTDLLNRTFGPFVDQICASGGDVVAFAGDSVLAVWEDASSPPKDRASDTATLCALDLLGKHHTHLEADPLYLPMRLSIGSGEIYRLELGGVGDRWMHLAAGDAVEEALRGDSLRLRDRVVLPAVVANRMASKLVGEWVDGTHFAAARLSHDAPEWSDADRPAPVPDSLLRHFVPEAIVQRLAAGPSQFVAEFRNVTAVFLGFDPARTCLPSFGQAGLVP
jgi:class 3 adenylate cyclase